MSLINAARDGNLQEVQRLVNSGANIHIQDDQALIDAAYQWTSPSGRILSRSMELTFMLRMIKLLFMQLEWGTSSCRILSQSRS